MWFFFKLVTNPLWVVTALCEWGWTLFGKTSPNPKKGDTMRRDYTDPKEWLLPTENSHHSQMEVTNFQIPNENVNFFFIRDEQHKKLRYHYFCV